MIVQQLTFKNAELVLKVRHCWERVRRRGGGEVRGCLQKCDKCFTKECGLAGEK